MSSDWLPLPPCRAQCRRETATALTMVVEARKALAWVTEDKEQTEQHRDRLGAELSRCGPRFFVFAYGAAHTSRIFI